MEIGEGLVIVCVAFAIVLGILGFVYLIVWSPSIQPSDYSKCLRGCPKTDWSAAYTDLDCPRMCAELLEENDYNENWTTCDFNTDYWYNEGKGRVWSNDSEENENLAFNLNKATYCFKHIKIANHKE